MWPMLQYFDFKVIFSSLEKIIPLQEKFKHTHYYKNKGTCRIRQVIQLVNLLAFGCDSDILIDGLQMYPHHHSLTKAIHMAEI